MTVVSPAVLADLAPTGKLRAGINFSNFLLTAREPDGTPRGVALDLAHELGRRLGVPRSSNSRTRASSRRLRPRGSGTSASSAPSPRGRC